MKMLPFMYTAIQSATRQAAAMLGAMGYTNIANIGGIAANSRKVEM